MAHYEIDEVKMRVAEMLGPIFSQYGADEIAELEAALQPSPQASSGLGILCQLCQNTPSHHCHIRRSGR